MSNRPNFTSAEVNRIKTLAQRGTAIPTINYKSAYVTGKGTDLINNPTLLKKAKRKAITLRTILCLIDVAKKKGDLERVQAYWNTYHCQQNILSSENKIYGKYCKNRFCTVCLAIRKANIINRYHPELAKWNEPFFVTLTVKAIKEQNLNKWIKGMLKAFNLIKNRCNKRHKRGKGIKLMGIKSLECNFNPQTQTYNPHFHIIVPNKEIAILLRNEWMKQWTKQHTRISAQHIRRVRDLERDLIETIKYGSKIFTEVDIKKKRNKAVPPMIYAYALDNIFVAMKGVRIFDRFGFNLPKQKVAESASSAKFIHNYDEWHYSSTLTDWVNNSTGECLTGYVLPKELSFILDNYINLELR